MNFGLFAEFFLRQGMTQHEAFQESMSQIDMAEESGLDSVWLAEHHFDPARSVLSSPIPMASAIASRTKRIRIGLAVQVLPLTNPVRVAEEAATVDHISQGRFDLGVGRSGIRRSYDGYNLDFQGARATFREALDVIMKAWDSDVLEHDGDHFHFHGINVVPKPFQKPHPPVWVAAASPDTYPVMGALGHPIFVSIIAGMERVVDRVKEYQKAWSDAGHPGVGPVSLRIPTYLAETAAQARNEPEASTRLGIDYAATELADSATSPELAERFRQVGRTPYDEVLKDRLMYGTPEAVIDRLNMYRDLLGISGVVLETNYGGQIPADKLNKSLRLIADKVMPAFR